MKSQPCQFTIEALEDRRLASAVPPDFNNDGLTDVVEVTSPTTIVVKLAQSDGSYVVSATLTAPKNLPVGGVNVDDRNGDGKLDIVAGGIINNRFYSHIWHGNGDGTFAPRVTDKPTRFPKWWV
jgi:hypothetical protein